MKWNFQTDRPVYIQIEEILAQKIAGGVFSPGERLPSVRAMAEDAGVTPNTVQRALAALEASALIETYGTRGKRVTSDLYRIRALRAELAEQILSAASEQLRALGLSEEEMRSLWMHRI